MPTAPTQFTTAQLDADSPWNETAATLIKTSFDYVIDYATGYIKTGLVDQAAIINDAVGEGELKNSSAAVSTTSLTFAQQNFGVAGAVFEPYVSGSHGAYLYYSQSPTPGVGTTSTSSVTLIELKCGQGGTAYATVFYVQASPPHKLGTIEDWPFFLELVRRKSDGKILHAAACPEPVWYFAGKARGLPKDHPAAPYLHPHRFHGLTMEGPSDSRVPICPPDHEIVLVDVRSVMGAPRYVDRAALELAACQRMRAQALALGVPQEQVDTVEAALAAECQAPADARGKRRIWCRHPARAFELETRAMGFGSHLERLLTMPEVTNATQEIGMADRRRLPRFKDMPGGVTVVCCP
jgi:hypothetical protein